jgi:hypothetical protein
MLLIGEEAQVQANLVPLATAKAVVLRVVSKRGQNLVIGWLHGLI